MKIREFFEELLKEGCIKDVLENHPELSQKDVSVFFAKVINLLKEEENRWEIFIDGASAGNPGRGGIGVVIFNEGRIIKTFSEFIGNVTNNVAEYRALLRALEESLKMGLDSIVVYSDSELVVKQMNGVYKTNDPNLKQLRDKALKLANSFRSFKITHIPREKNKIADKLAKESASKGGE